MPKLVVDKRSNYPLHAQIKEQIKLALTFGDLRPGEVLPSIREVSRSLEIGQAIVRRAYKELLSTGILSLDQTKRMVANKNLSYVRNAKTLKRTQRLALQFCRQAATLGIHPKSFAHYALSRVVALDEFGSFFAFTDCNKKEADQYAQQVSRAWGIAVQGITLGELRDLPKDQLRRTHYVITVPYHYEDALEVVGKLRKHLVTVSVNWDPEMLHRIGSVRAGGRIAFVFDHVDCIRYGRTVVTELKGLFPDFDATFSCVPFQEIEDIPGWLDEEKWDLVYFSNVLWDSLPEQIRFRRNVAAPRLTLDPLSLERARVEVGLLC